MIQIKRIHYISDKGRSTNDSMFYAKKFLCKEHGENINNQSDQNNGINNTTPLNNSIDSIIKLGKFAEKITENQ